MTTGVAKVLILDADALSAVAAVQSLGRRGVEVHALAKGDCLAFGSRFVHRMIKRDEECSRSELLEQVRRLDATEHYTLVLPAAEFSLGAMQECGDADPLRSKAVMPSRASVEIALDKGETWSLARRLGIPVPDARMLGYDETPSRDGPFPLVLKASRSQVSREGRVRYAPVCIARDGAECEAYLEEWRPYTAIQQQTYFPGKGWGIECLYEHGTMRWSFAHRRIHELPITGGGSTYRVSAECPEPLLRSARTLLDALQWHGVAMVEFRQDEAGNHVLLEINPRLWGSLPLAIRAGVDFPFGLLRIASGESPGETPVFRRGLYMRNVVTDLDWMVENWRSDHTDGLLLTAPRLRSLLEWARPLLGMEAWDHFTLSDPRLALIQIRTVLSRLHRAARLRITRMREHAAMRRVHERNLLRLRRGELSHDRLVFVCHGNICRSPVAEYLARQQLPDRSIESSGTHAQAGRTTPDRICTVARELGIDLGPHRAKSMQLVGQSSQDLLLVMDPSNYREILARNPEARDRVLFLGMFGGPRSLSIPDPLRTGFPAARQIMAKIEQAVCGLAQVLAAGR